MENILISLTEGRDLVASSVYVTGTEAVATFNPGETMTFDTSLITALKYRYPFELGCVPSDGWGRYPIAINIE